MAAWGSDDVVWGSTECQRKSCSAAAECLLDGLPLCLGDADELVERMEAVEIYPNLRELLPAWGG